jgi:hypothetical protein
MAITCKIKIMRQISDGTRSSQQSCRLRVVSVKGDG